MLNSFPFRMFIVISPDKNKEFINCIRKNIPNVEIICFEKYKDLYCALWEKAGLVLLTEKNHEHIDNHITEIKKLKNDIPVIVISKSATLENAVRYLRLGVSDYLLNDQKLFESLKNSVNRILKTGIRKANLNLTLPPDSYSTRYSKFIVGKSKSIRKIFSLLDKAVNTNITVSIYGETGTGKEMIAKAIHEFSDRSTHPFVPVNITAIPDELIESELFGHEKGAFTGAIQKRIGKFEEAQNGTIFLDEIGEMNINMQSKLLRVLQEKEISRIGGNNIIPLNVRVITATHRNLAHAVKKGTFREDLYYRLLGLPIHLPPLRDRDNDILLLSHHFLKEFSKDNNLPNVQLSQGAQEKLMSYHYPGNVRELKSIIELALVMSGNELIKPSNISFNALIPEEELLYQELTLKEYNAKIIKHFLEKYEDNIQEVSRRLDISRSTIYRYIKEKATTQV